ncbi:complex I subunit 4 family protein [Streptomyces bohaiensis]|uniref:complex I subunit 4 family protein n=1 Tax=Streptomyces bohaiensis TaxID=1431344 RepID=UPI003B784059
MLTLTDSVTAPLLAAVVTLPLLAAVVLLVLPRGPESTRTAGRIGVAVTGAVLVGTLLLAAAFDRGAADRPQAVTDVAWVPAFGVRLHLGVDGISLPLLVLTALLCLLCAVHVLRRPPAGEGGAGPRGLVVLLLVLETGTLATFAALDLILFFLAFETVLIPMYFVISRWGGAERAAAAWKFVLYTLLGSVVMLLGFLLVGLQAGTFDMVVLAEAHGDGLSRTTQILAVLAIGIGLAVKTPMWPLHSWLPDAHTAAPTVGSVLLAGVLLKLGTYGLVRIVLPVAPEGIHFFAPYLAAFAVTGIIYGSLACLALVRAGAGGDLKRLIAYSSVGHMGFVLLGIATLTPTGVNGALFANIAHGVITALLFLLAGAVRERTGTTDLDRLAEHGGGARLYGRAPRLGALLAFTAVASLGLPGLAGFWGELLAMLGAFNPAEGLSRPVFVVCLALAGLGTLLTAAYLLQVVRRVCAGTPPDAAPATADDARPGAHGATPAPATDAGTIPAATGTASGAAAATGAATATATGTATAAPPGEAVRQPDLPDLHRDESALLLPLAALTLLIGLWPALLLRLTDPAVQLLLEGVGR